MTDYIGQTETATFMDGMWQPSEPPTIAEQAKKAGAGGDGSTLIFSHLKSAGCTYEMHEKPDGLGGTALHVFSIRRGPTSINPRGPQTTDAMTEDAATAAAVQREFASNRAHAAKITGFWDKRAAEDAKARG